MARHLVATPDPALVWADSNLESPDAVAHLEQRRADIAARRERRHEPEPVVLDEYDDDDDIDEWVEHAPAPREVPTVALGLDIPRAAPRYRRGGA